MSQYQNDCKAGPIIKEFIGYEYTRTKEQVVASAGTQSVQARAVGITARRADRWRPTRLKPVARVWKGASLVSKVRCIDAYELLNSYWPIESRCAILVGH